MNIIDSVCMSLESTKIMERRRAAEQLIDLINDENVLQLLSEEDNRYKWDAILQGIQHYLIKECERNFDAEKAKSSSVTAERQKKIMANLLIATVTKANSNGARLNGNKLMNLILRGLDSYSLRKHFAEQYVKILVSFYLPIKQYWTEIEENKLIDIFSLLQGLYNTQTSSNFLKTTIIEGLYLLVKYSHLHPSLGIYIRQLDTLITKICAEVNDRSPVNQQKCIVKLTIAYCEKVSKDCRLVSCKLGEEIFPSIVALYQPRFERNDSVKSLIFDFILLQIRLHNPCGLLEGHTATYAFNWERWKTQLKKLAYLIFKEVNIMLIEFKSKNGHNHNNLWPNFVNMVVEVFRQISNEKIDALDMTVDDFTEQTSKKRKVEFGFRNILTEIEKSNWAWMEIYAKIFEKYPDTVNPGDYIDLLKSLSEIQIDCKEISVRHHLYSLLTSMVYVDLTNRPFEKSIADSFWLKIWDTALRTVGLYQNESSVHSLIQALLKTQKAKQLTPLLELYLSGVLNSTLNNVVTLDVLGSRIRLPETFGKEQVSTRNRLLNWVLESKDSDSNYLLSVPSRVNCIVALTLKTWLPVPIKTEDMVLEKNSMTIEKCAVAASLGKDILEKFDKLGDKGTYLPITEAYIDLLEMIQNQLRNLYDDVSLENMKSFLDFALLLLTVLSKMFDYDLINEETYVEIIDFDSFFMKFEEKLEYIMENNQTSLYDILLKIETLFTTRLNKKIMMIFREKARVDFMKVIFDVFNSSVPNDPPESTRVNVFSLDENRLADENQLGRDEKVSLTSLKIIANFCCFEDQETLMQTQSFALESITENSNFDQMNLHQTRIHLNIIEALLKCRPGVLTASLLKYIMKILTPLVMCWQRYNDVAVLILNIMNKAIFHFSKTDSPELKNEFLKLFEPFIENKCGIEVSIRIIKCLTSILLSNFLEYNETSEKEIARYLTDYLKHDFYEVRLIAIQNITKIFRMDDCDQNLRNRKQTLLFLEIPKKLIEAFTVNDNISREQQTDESVTRTSSSFQTYASIIIVNPLFRKRALFALIQLYTKLNISQNLMLKILEVISKKLKLKSIKDILHLNMNYLVSHWTKSGYDLDSFPFNLIGCHTSSEFFNMYLKVVVPIMMQNNDLKLLEDVSKDTNKSLNEMVEDCYPIIMAKHLPVFAQESLTQSLTRSDIDEGTKVQKSLYDIFTGDRVMELLSVKVDEVFVQLIDKFFDADHFQDQFAFSKTLPLPDPPYYNYQIFIETVQYVESKISPSNSLISHCIKTNPEQLINISLQITQELYNSSICEEILISLHRYSIFVDYITIELLKSNSMREFLIRNIVYNLLNLITENKKTNTDVSIAANRYFKKFIAKSLSSCNKVFEKFLAHIISQLVPIAKLDDQLGAECTETLKFLIEANSNLLYSAIGKLDPFPSLPQFQEIQEIYERITYGNENFSLKDAIVHFLNVENATSFECRLEGLMYLKEKLKNKIELSRLYENLKNLRGFSEDCKTSILHRLICLLVKLTKSNDVKVSLEAARCLGEIGPIDLTTMVLEPEKSLDKDVENPILHLTGQSVTLLTNYLVDPKIEVVIEATKALKNVLTSKEGKLVTKSHFQDDFGCGKLNLDFITPFLLLKSSHGTKWSINDELFENLVNDSEIWLPKTAITHSEWIINLVCNILQVFPHDSILNAFIPVCKVKYEFAEQLFPILVYILLFTNNKKRTKILSEQIQKFFAEHWRNYKDFSSVSLNRDEITLNKASVQAMLNVIHFMRQKLNALTKKVVELDLNYLHVAKGAQFCSAHFTSILYAELWCYNIIDVNMINKNDMCSTLDYICKIENDEETQALQNILREAYKNIGDMDAIHGCGTSYLFNTKSRIEYYKHLGKWDKVSLHYDIELSTGRENSYEEFLSSLQHKGFDYLASKTNAENSNILDINYECAWRLNNWNLPTFETKNEMQDYEKYHYLALHSYHSNDFVTMDMAITEARKLVLQNLSHASLESSKNLYKPLMQLQCLTEIENFVTNKGFTGILNLLNNWKSYELFGRNEFSYTEPIQAQRITILKDIISKNDEEDFKFHLANSYLKLANEARIEGFTHISERALSNLSYIDDLTNDIKEKIMFQRALLHWEDDKRSGQFLLGYLLSNTQTPHLKAEALKQYGNWMVETRSENPQMIIDKYFKPALDLMRDIDSAEDLENQCQTINSLALFADAQYQEILNYMTSSVYQNKLTTITKFKEMARNIMSSDGAKTQDHRRAIAMYERQRAIDETEVNNTQNEKQTYLKLAVSNYTQLLRYCDSYNLIIFRILSLCLSNKQCDEIIFILREVLDEIASYKFIPVLPQLVPHIGSGNLDNFEALINTILERCMVEHPHHTLPIIIALADSYKDRDFDKSTVFVDVVENRVLSAKNMIAKFKNNRQIGPIIKDMELLTTALVSLAYFPKDKWTGGKKGDYNIPRTEKIRSIKNMYNVLLPTINIPVNPTGNYTNIIGIHEFDSTFSSVGGVNEPKKIVCRGTDGISRTQLVKGKDDLRQDAVMQQVFTILNTLLSKNKHTSKLHIRTYKVMPLSQRSGVIEWCENTEPLGVYLTEAHKTFYPTDWSAAKCRKQLQNVAKKSNDVKYRDFVEICQNFRPVFHKFFTTNYPQPTVWYERRKAYMNSVATSSMIGYILGLGDRHVQNILIDKRTAEVIHIDFGIAFEQGRILPTPETVPFRLTRDIEAGMGVCGIEGLFRRSCENTMVVLRQNKETIITILEVLLYDPLYAWTITASEAYSRQRDEDDDVSLNFSEANSSTNITAERALTRIKQKLQGTENGGVSSIEGQVQHLIQEARDPVNLSRLFNGWQAYF